MLQMTTLYLEAQALETKIDLLPWQKQGLQYTATGYGGKIPTQYKVKHKGIWRRVYCAIYSNSGTLYIMQTGVKLIVRDYPL